MRDLWRYIGRRTPSLGVGVVLALAVLSCSSAVPTETPGVERMGEFVLRAKVPEAELVLGYKFANMSLGNEWLILEIAVTSPQGQSAKVERENIFVRTPEGVRIPASTQRAFNEAYSAMRNTISQANVARDPLDYFPPNRIKCSLQLYVAPGEGVVFDQVTVNDRRACEGKIFFFVPGGVQPGRWVLGIDLEESDIRVPFDLAAR
jgi:hypothetical protein